MGILLTTSPESGVCLSISADADALYCKRRFGTVEDESDRQAVPIEFRFRGLIASSLDSQLVGVTVSESSGL